MLEYNGKPYARVSEILSPFVNFQGIPPEVLERKAIIGTHVHKAIEQEIEGDFPTVFPHEVGYFQSFEKWRNVVSPNFVRNEMRCYCHEKMLTGCIDALVKLDGEKEAILVDWKTSAVESPITWPLQGHMYTYLLQQNGFTVAPRFLFVKLDKSGNMPKVFEYKFNSNTLQRCFQAIDDFWEAQKKNSADNCL